MPAQQITAGRRILEQMPCCKLPALNARLHACPTVWMRIPYPHIEERGTRMSQAFDTKAPKRPTNVTINSDLLAKAKELKINLSATLEAALSEMVNARQRELWKSQNKASIEAYNQLIEREGTFSDELRSF